MLLLNVLNSTWSAECAEFASIVTELELVITIHCKNYYIVSALQTTAVVVK